MKGIPIWSNTASRAIVVDVPEALREGLLAFLPEEDALPQRLQEGAEPFVHEEVLPPSEPEPPPAFDLRRAVWSFIHRAPTMPNGGERVGEAHLRDRALAASDSGVPADA